MKIYDLNADDTLEAALNEFGSLMKNNPGFSSSSISLKKVNGPHSNIIKTLKGFRIDIAIPGFSRGDFNVIYEEGTIAVSVDKKEEISAEKYVSREFNFNKFNKSWLLKTSTNAEQIDAVYNSGVLSINIPTQYGTTTKKVIQVT